MLERRINIAEAKKHLSEIVGKVAYGHEKILLTKRGVPMVEIVPIPEKKKHLADVKGWLDNDDPFFEAIKTFQSYVPRVLRNNP